jgi:hypothetical protein
MNSFGFQRKSWRPSPYVVDQAIEGEFALFAVDDLAAAQNAFAPHHPRIGDDRGNHLVHAESLGVPVKEALMYSA